MRDAAGGGFRYDRHGPLAPGTLKGRCDSRGRLMEMRARRSGPAAHTILTSVTPGLHNLLLCWGYPRPVATEGTRHDVVSAPLGSPAWVRSVQKRERR